MDGYAKRPGSIFVFSFVGFLLFVLSCVALCTEFCIFSSGSFAHAVCVLFGVFLVSIFSCPGLIMLAKEM